MIVLTDYNRLNHRWSAWPDDNEELTQYADSEQEAIDNVFIAAGLSYSQKPLEKVS
jgi:hypothetical protein